VKCGKEQENRSTVTISQQSTISFSIEVADGACAACNWTPGRMYARR
jgi:hypothetical protein